MDQEKPLTWHFPNISDLAPGEDLIAIGANLQPETLLEAYQSGYFPMPVEGEIGWFSPNRRGVLFLNDFHQSRSLAKSRKKFRYSHNQNFLEVINSCANPERPHGWITSAIKKAYLDLHHQGWAHSIEVWQDTTLVGGLYGLSVSGLFAGESMFHHVTDASKAALAYLVELLLAQQQIQLVDVQWLTPHLQSLGCVEIHREQYAQILKDIMTATPQKLHL